MAGVTAKVPVSAWELTYESDAANSHKFYRVFVSDDGVVVLRWGRIGTQGQQSVSLHPTADEARDVALRQVYAKKSKGYVQELPEHKFAATALAVERAKEGYPSALYTEYQNSLEEGRFDGAKAVVLSHYDDFAEQARSLMERAPDANFETIMDEYQQFEAVWEEIHNRHTEVEAVLDLTKRTLMQKLMGGGS